MVKQPQTTSTQIGSKLSWTALNAQIGHFKSNASPVVQLKSPRFPNPRGLLLLLVLVFMAGSTYASTCNYTVHQPEDRQSFWSSFYFGLEGKDGYRKYTLELRTETKLIVKESFETKTVDGMLSPLQRHRDKWASDCKSIRKKFLKKGLSARCDNAALEEIIRINCQPRLQF